MRGGKAKTEYSTDDGATWITGTSCTVLAPADHSNDGPRAVLYRSTDLAGNKEDDESVTVNIDTTGPSITAEAASGRRGKPITLSYTITDELSDTATGVVVTIRTSKGRTVKIINVRGSVSMDEPSTVTWTTKIKGTYSYTVTAKDEAGNRGTSAKAVITVR